MWVHFKLLLIGRPVQTMQLAVCHHGVPSTLCRKRRTVGGSPDGDSFSVSMDEGGAPWNSDEPNHTSK